MKKGIRKAIKAILYVMGALLALFLGTIVYIRAVAYTDPPPVGPSPFASMEREEGSPGFYRLGNNWFRKSESGLYELYVEGNAFDRGVIIGKLTKERIAFQEEVFHQQIHRLVPSNAYLSILKYFIGWFNRDLDQFVDEEFKQEIYGISLSASPAYNDIAPPYQRLLNYHAAHDIGHALQNMSLVGCTSFSTWADRSVDSTLIIGRNFDFYVGDDFAQDKIIAFYKPDTGHPFAMVTFGGMTGVLSGMNDQGLTVTINASKSSIPLGAATPVSIVAREILQYAATIDEAYAIAQKRKMFVAESFLIGSARDHRAALIEKDMDATDLYEPTVPSLVCTNHFQGKAFGGTEKNQEHIADGASLYRYERVGELLASTDKNSVATTAHILRDRWGKENKNLGFGNEKAINQFIAHHAVIFVPEKKQMWVSTHPWQLGKMVCYQLDSVFKEKMPSSHEVYDSALTIPPDPFYATSDFQRYLKFHPYRYPFSPRTGLVPDSVVTWNPDSYLSYMLAGDKALETGDNAKAIQYYTQALAKEVATTHERRYLQQQLEKIKKKLP